MKRLWILNHYAQKPSGAGGTRHFSLARHLLKYGWQITIIASSVEHLTGRQRLPLGCLRARELIEGVEFLWLKGLKYRGNGLLRIFNMVSYMLMVLSPWGLSGLKRPDVIIGSTVHPLAALSGEILSRRYRVPFIFEIRDLWPKTLIDMGKIRPNGLTARYLYKLERYLCDRADRILTLLPGTKDYLYPSGVPEEKIVWLPNGAEAPAIPPSANTNDSFVLMYVGAHGAANDLDTLIEALAELESMKLPVPFLCRLIGEGPEKKRLMEKAEALKISRVRFEAPVPKSRVPEVASQADAFVLTVRDIPGLYRYGISMNKIFDYMAAARPIIIAVDAGNNPIEEARCGISVPPESPKALAEAIETVIRTSPEDRHEMGLRGFTHLKANYSYEVLAERLGAVLQDVVEGEHE